MAVVGLALGVVLAPSFAFAEVDTTVSAGASADASVSAADARSGLVAPRDQATGQSSGKRQYAPVMMNGSSTAGAGAEIEAREQMRIKMEDRASVNASTSVERREAAQERRVEVRNDARRALGERMILRLVAALDRLATLADRIESRATKLTDKGADVSTTAELLVVARAKIADGRVAIDEARVSLNGTTTATTAGTRCLGGASGTRCISDGALASQGNQMLRAHLERANAAVRAAHKALVDAVVSLKASVKVGTTGENGTSTSQTASTSVSAQ